MGILYKLPLWLECRDELSSADAILVLDGGEEGQRFATGVDLLRRGYAPRLVVSQAGLGGEEFLAPLAAERAPIRADPAARACWEKIDWMRSRAVSTFEEALEARQVLKRLGCTSVLVVTSTYHTRRAREIFSRLLSRDGIEVRVFPAPAPAMDATPWWGSRTARFLVLSELIKWISTLCHLDGRIPRDWRIRLGEWVSRVIE